MRDLQRPRVDFQRKEIGNGGQRARSPPRLRSQSPRLLDGRYSARSNKNAVARASERDVVGVTRGGLSNYGAVISDGDGGEGRLRVHSVIVIQHFCRKRHSGK